MMLWTNNNNKTRTNKKAKIMVFRALVNILIPCIRIKLRYQVVQPHGNFTQTYSLFSKEPAFGRMILKEKNPLKQMPHPTALKQVDLDLSFQLEEVMIMILLMST